jgi:tetratricopeptide (TPR) repeat protein
LFFLDTHSEPVCLLALCQACLRETDTATASLIEAFHLNFEHADLEYTPEPCCTKKVLESAKHQIEGILHKKPNDAKAFFGLAVISTLTKNYKQAIALLSSSLKTNPQNVDALLVRANCLLSSKDSRAALLDINHAIELAPTDQNCYLTLERYYSLSGNYDRFFADLDKRTAKYSHNASLWIAKAQAFEKRRDRSKAIECYAHALAIDPGRADAYNGRGRLYAQALKYHEAVTDFTSAIKAKPDSPYAYRDRATCYFALNRINQATDDLSRVIDLTQDPKAYRARSECYHRLGRYDLAESDKQSAEQNPSGAVDNSF